MIDQVALIFSALALAISATTAWLTLLQTRHGEDDAAYHYLLRSRRSTFARRHTFAEGLLRTLLFSTSKRGRIVENMYVALSRNEARQNFNIWVYGEGDKLVRGSGLFVGETGVATNHHFLAPKDGSSFGFAAGRYRVEVFAHLLGDRNRRLLFSQTLEITHEVAAMLVEPVQACISTGVRML